jgi:acyl-CoA synthetase (AMP-forming)/AMP-acid ligase II
MTNPLHDALFAPQEGSDKVFLHLPDGGSLSYAEFLGLANRTANALVALGVAPGDRVAVHVEKSPQALALYAACITAGVVFLPLNTAYTAASWTISWATAGPRCSSATRARRRRWPPSRRPSAPCSGRWGRMARAA